MRNDLEKLSAGQPIRESWISALVDRINETSMVEAGGGLVVDNLLNTFIRLRKSGQAAESAISVRPPKQTDKSVGERVLRTDGTLAWPPKTSFIKPFSIIQLFARDSNLEVSGRGSGVVGCLPHTGGEANLGLAVEFLGWQGGLVLHQGLGMLVYKKSSIPTRKIVANDGGTSVSSSVLLVGDRLGPESQDEPDTTTTTPGESSTEFYGTPGVWDELGAFSVVYIWEENDTNLLLEDSRWDSEYYGLCVVSLGDRNRGDTIRVTDNWSHSSDTRFSQEVCAIKVGKNDYLSAKEIDDQGVARWTISLS